VDNLLSGAVRHLARAGSDGDGVGGFSTCGKSAQHASKRQQLSTVDHLVLLDVDFRRDAPARGLSDASATRADAARAHADGTATRVGRTATSAGRTAARAGPTATAAGPTATGAGPTADTCQSIRGPRRHVCDP